MTMQNKFAKFSLAKILDFMFRNKSGSATSQEAAFVSESIAQEALEKFAAMRALERWNSPVHIHNSVQNFESLTHIQNGLHTIIENGQLIDVLLDLKPDLPIVVMFNGAQKRHDSLKLPIFSGLNAVPHDKVSRVYVNDPTLYLSSEIQMGFYGGSKELPLQKLLPRIINKIQRTNCSPRLIFGGGSNGGFAALYYSNLFPGSLAVVLNPQTNILKYYEDHIVGYADAAFGLSNLESVREHLSRFIDYDLCELYNRRHENHVLYMQNLNDLHHVRSHCRPFARALGHNIPAQLMVSKLNTGLLLHIENWGKGHKRAPANYWSILLNNLIDEQKDWKSLFKDDSIVEIVQRSLRQEKVSSLSASQP